MIAIFCDFYGTVVYENGPISYEVIMRVYKSGNAQSPEAVVEYWWSTFRKVLDEHCGENYRLQSELALENFKKMLVHFNSNENAVELCQMMEEHWSNPPIYDDTKSFMENVSLPIYFVTNSDDRYILEAIENHGLKPEGVITSERSKYTKPRPEMFQYALDKFNLHANEVVHIGDSMSGDVEGSTALGIKALWLNRNNEPIPDGVQAVSNLDEARKILESILDNEK